MTRTWIGRGMWAFIVLAAGGVGFLSGRSQQIEASIRMLQTEAAGNLVQRIETLSLLRMGDADGAITRLESEADGLTLSIASSPGSDHRALAYMKTLFERRAAFFVEGAGSRAKPCGSDYFRAEQVRHRAEGAPAFCS